MVGPIQALRWNPILARRVLARTIANDRQTGSSEQHNGGESCSPNGVPQWPFSWCTEIRREPDIGADLLVPQLALIAWRFVNPTLRHCICPVHNGPGNQASNADHGTTCASIALASANYECSRGIAFDATLSKCNFKTDKTVAGLMIISGDRFLNGC